MIFLKNVKFFILLTFLLIGSSLVYLTLDIANRDIEKTPNRQEIVETATNQSNTEKIEFTASFEVYTNGTKRIFTDSKYHNQSTDVFIDKLNPNIVTVKKVGVTWDDFFKTLPMQLTKDCLITGTKQTFCNTKDQKLLFSINGYLTPDALDKEILKGDQLLVSYEYVGSSVED